MDLYFTSLCIYKKLFVFVNKNNRTYNLNKFIKVMSNAVKFSIRKTSN